MRTITACRACGSPDLVPVLDLGDQHLSEFDTDPAYRPPRFPLELVYCQGCTLAQLRHTAPPELLYHDQYSFKSGVSDAIRRDLQDVVLYALKHQPDGEHWLDIASNDGTLLSCVPPSWWTTGIDPLEQFTDEAAEHAHRIVVDFFDPKHFVPGAFDVVTSVSMFYDLDDPGAFVAGVVQVLASDGIWVIQQNYAPWMLAAHSVDNISHEHLAYYSMRSLGPLLARHGLEINDVQLNPINGGCFRTLVSHAGSRPVLPSVAERLDDELSDDELGAGTSRFAYEAFGAYALGRLEALGDYVRSLNQGGKRVYVYGASTRGAVLWQGAGLDVADLPAVVERNPAKVGRYMSAIGSPIISEEQMRADPPPFLLVGPWWLRDSFLERERAYLEAGGAFIFPLPELEVVRL